MSNNIDKNKHILNYSDNNSHSSDNSNNYRSNKSHSNTKSSDTFKTSIIDI